ncbi:MAG: PAS domain S-box protein [Burkholderiaceae bacterium]
MNDDQNKPGRAPQANDPAADVSGSGSAPTARDGQERPELMLRLSRHDIEAMASALTSAYSRVQETRTRLETGLRERSRELERVRKHLEVVYDSISDGLLVIDEYGDVQTGNRSACQIFGLGTGEMVGQRIADLLSDLDLGAGHEQEAREMLACRRDGSLVSVQAGVRIIDVEGERLLMVTLRDLSHVRYTEQMLREQAMLLDHSGKMVLTLDRRFLITGCNRAFEDATGYGIDQVQGVDPRSFLFDEDTPEALLSSLAADIAAGQRLQFEVLIQRACGRPMWLELEGFPATAADGSLLRYSLIGTDISERKRTDQLKVDFVSMVSHELRTPLTSITGAFETLESTLSGHDDPWCGELVSMGQRNCSTLVRLVEDLSISATRSGRDSFALGDIELGDCSHDAIGSLSMLATEREVGIEVVGESDLDVRADHGRLVQVLTNVLGNAIKFSPPGSTVRVRVGAEQGRVSIQVADQGPGVPAEFVPQMFTRFSRDSQVQASGAEGFGLGLAICRSLLEQMAGEIVYRDNPGGGALFEISLDAAGTRWAPRARFESVAHRALAAH